MDNRLPSSQTCYGIIFERNPDGTNQNYIPVTKKEFTIGCDINCDINIDLNNVSVPRCNILIHQDKAFINNNSTVGTTKLNGKEVETSYLKQLDEIEICGKTFVWTYMSPVLKSEISQDCTASKYFLDQVYTSPIPQNNNKISQSSTKSGIKTPSQTLSINKALFKEAARNISKLLSDERKKNKINENYVDKSYFIVSGKNIPCIGNSKIAQKTLWVTSDLPSEADTQYNSNKLFDERTNIDSSLEPEIIMSNNEHSFHVTSGIDQNQIYSVNNGSTDSENITPPHRPPILSKCPKTTKPKQTKFSGRKIEFDRISKSDSRIYLINSHFNSDSEFTIANDEINETDLIRNSKDMIQFDDKNKQDDDLDGILPLDMNISTEKCTSDSLKLKSPVFDVSHVNGSRNTSPDDGLILLNESFTSARRINLENTFKAEDLLKNLENRTVTQEIDKSIEITPNSKNNLLNNTNIEVLEYKHDANSSLFSLKCKYNFDWPSNCYDEFNSSASTMTKTNQVGNRDTNSLSVNKINNILNHNNINEALIISNDFNENSDEETICTDDIQTPNDISVNSLNNESNSIKNNITNLTPGKKNSKQIFNTLNLSLQITKDESTIGDKNHSYYGNILNLISSDDGMDNGISNHCSTHYDPVKKETKKIKRNNSKQTNTSLSVNLTKNKPVVVNKTIRKFSTSDSDEEMDDINTLRDCSVSFDQIDDQEICNKNIEVIPNSICEFSKNEPAKRNKTIKRNNSKQTNTFLSVQSTKNKLTVNKWKLSTSDSDEIDDINDFPNDCSKHYEQTEDQEIFNKDIEVIPNDICEFSKDEHLKKTYKIKRNNNSVQTNTFLSIQPTKNKSGVVNKKKIRKLSTSDSDDEMVDINDTSRNCSVYSDKIDNQEIYNKNIELISNDNCEFSKNEPVNKNNTIRRNNSKQINKMLSVHSTNNKSAVNKKIRRLSTSDSDEMDYINDFPNDCSKHYEHTDDQKICNKDIEVIPNDIYKFSKNEHLKKTYRIKRNNNSIQTNTFLSVQSTKNKLTVNKWKLSTSDSDEIDDINDFPNDCSKHYEQTEDKEIFNKDIEVIPNDICEFSKNEHLKKTYKIKRNNNSVQTNTFLSIQPTKNKSGVVNKKKIRKLSTSDSDDEMVDINDTSRNCSVYSDKIDNQEIYNKNIELISNDNCEFSKNEPLNKNNTIRRNNSKQINKMLSVHSTNNKSAVNKKIRRLSTSDSDEMDYINDFPNDCSKHYEHTDDQKICNKDIEVIPNDIYKFSKNEHLKKTYRIKRNNNSIQTNTFLSIQPTKNKSAVVYKKIRKFSTSDSDDEMDDINTLRNCSVYSDKIEDQELYNKNIELISNDNCEFSKNKPVNKNNTIGRNNSKQINKMLSVHSTNNKSAVHKKIRRLSTSDSGEMDDINDFPNDCSKHYEHTDDQKICNKDIEVIPNDIYKFSKNEHLKKTNRIKRNNSKQINTSLSVQPMKNKSSVVYKKIQKFSTSDSDEEMDDINTLRDCSVYSDKIEDQELYNKNIELISYDNCEFSKNEPVKKNNKIRRTNSKQINKFLSVQSTNNKSAVLNKKIRKLSTSDSGEMDDIKHYEQTDDQEIFNKDIEVIPNDICTVSKNYIDNPSDSSLSPLNPFNSINNIKANKTLTRNDLKQTDISNVSVPSTINSIKVVHKNESSKVIQKYLSLVSDQLFKTDTHKDCLKHLVQTSNRNIEIPNIIDPNVSNNESNSLRDKKTLNYFDNSNLSSLNDAYTTVKKKSKTKETPEKKNYEQKINFSKHIPITVCKTLQSYDDDELEENENVSKIYLDNSLNTSIGKPQHESTPWNRPKSPKPLYYSTQSIQYDETTHDILSDNENTHKNNCRPISPSNTEEFYQLMEDFNKSFPQNKLVSKKISPRINDISTSKSNINSIIPSKIKNSFSTNTKKQSRKTIILENKSSGVIKKKKTQKTKANTDSDSSTSESSLFVSNKTKKQSGKTNILKNNSSGITKKNLTQEAESNNSINLRHRLNTNTLSLRRSTRIKHSFSGKTTTMYGPVFEKNTTNTRSTRSNTLLTKSDLLMLHDHNILNYKSINSSKSKSLRETEKTFQKPQICDPSKSKIEKLKKKKDEDSKSLLPTECKRKGKVVKSLNISSNRSPRGHKRAADFPISGPNAKGTRRTRNK